MRTARFSDSEGGLPTPLDADPSEADPLEADPLYRQIPEADPLDADPPPPRQTPLEGDPPPEADTPVGRPLLPCEQNDRCF